MAEPPSEKDTDKEKKKNSENHDTIQSDPSLHPPQIIILEEREIPFKEEKPPNFSPHFKVRVHRRDQKESVCEDEE